MYCRNASTQLRLGRSGHAVSSLGAKRELLFFSSVMLLGGRLLWFRKCE